MNEITLAAFEDELVKLSKELTTEAREKLPKKEFAIAPDRYPIHDENHARNALARVSQFGSAAEKETVRSKVHAKYPDIGKS